MESTSSVTERDAGFRAPEVGGFEKAFAMAAGVAPADEPPPPPGSLTVANGQALVTLEKGEFIFGKSQLAIVAFILVLVITIMSAIAYFAGRRNGSPQVTERVIERVVQAPAPGPAPVAAAAAAPKAAESSVPPATPVPPATSKAEPVAPELSRQYLQLGSVEPGVAAVMVEGLRQKGLTSIVGTGINSRVARVLVGPFNTPEEQSLAQVKIEAMGFHPFPRTFSQRDLEQQPEPAAAAPVLQPSKP